MSPFVVSFLSSNSQHWQTDDFKRKLQTARELLEKLPGGDLHAQSQDEVIKMLEKCRDLKRYERSILIQFL